jgi:hypothetical protein
MALETLKGKDLGPHITVDHDTNTITFQLQNGPIADNGVNGCQVDDLVKVSRRIIMGLNKAFPCKENPRAVTNLRIAEMWLAERTRKRKLRGVEGHDKA